MRYVYLTEQFYIDYDEKNYSEIERKSLRPYIMIKINVCGFDCGIPLRSSVKHSHVFWTNKIERCGVDYSKAVIISNQAYIDNIKKPHIRPVEFKFLRGKEYLIKTGFKKYIKDYKEAFERIDIEKNKILCQMSTLQYFHKELKIE